MNKHSLATWPSRPNIINPHYCSSYNYQPLFVAAYMFCTARNASIPPDERWESLLTLSEKFNDATKKATKM